MSPTEAFTRYVTACDYPGALKVEDVECHLTHYLKAIGVERKIVRLASLWNLADHPSLERQVKAILDDFARRRPRAALAASAASADLAALDALDAIDARDASAALDALDASAASAASADLAARDAIDARDASAALDTSAMRRFARWCVQRGSWWWYRWDLSWIATTHIGALQTGSERVQTWSKPLFDAFLGGCWLLHFTDDTLYWVAKPTVHVERTAETRRLHNETGPALESDVENLYFWHGVMVPAYAVTYPHWITLEEIDREANAEVRRVLIERYGTARYLLDATAEEISRDECGILYRRELEGDEALVMVRVLNATPEAHGTLTRAEAAALFPAAAVVVAEFATPKNLLANLRDAVGLPSNTRFKEYFLRVPPEMRSAREAVAWTFDLSPEQYDPAVQT